MPKVSVCIPTYNHLSGLKKCLESVLMQTFEDYEIIITDDSTNDEIENYINSLKHPKIKYFHNVKSLGSPENWNEALRKADGELIKILHHDDWLADKNSLETFVKSFDNNPGASLYFSQSYVIKEGEEPWIHKITEAEVETISANAPILLLKNMIGAPTAVMFRKGSILFDKNLKWLVDIEFYIRLLQSKNALHYIPEPLVVTYAAEGRVTDECVNNRDIELFENFYVAEFISKQFGENLEHQKPVFNKLVGILKKYDVRNIEEIRKIGFKGKIDSRISKFLKIRSVSPALSNYYVKFQK